MGRRRGGGGSPFGGGADPIPVPRLTDKNLRGRGRRSARKPPGKIAKAFMVIVFTATFVGLIALFVTATAELPYRAGWAGVAGTVSSVSCEEEGTGRDESLVCTGEFTPTGASVAAETDVTIEGDNSFAADRDYPARLHSDGATVSVVGAKMVVYILSGMSAALMAIAVVNGYVLMALVQLARRRFGRPWQPSKLLQRLPMYLAGLFLVLAIAGAIVAANLTV